MNDDLLPLLATPGAHALTQGMGSPGGGVSYGQGVLMAWNDGTFENTVSYRGGVLRNVPLLAGADALTYRPGDTLAILSWAPNKGATVYWILGRLITPGPDRGTETIDWMTGELGKRLSVAVMSERLAHAQIEETESADWADDWHPLATPGPTISGVEVYTDKMEINFSCWMQYTAGQGGSMSVKIYDAEGDVVVQAGSAKLWTISGGAGDPTQWWEGSRTVLVEGLDPGVYRVESVYRASFDGHECYFTDRYLSVRGY